MTYLISGHDPRNGLRGTLSGESYTGVDKGIEAMVAQKKEEAEARQKRKKQADLEARIATRVAEARARLQAKIDAARAGGTLPPPPPSGEDPGESKSKDPGESNTMLYVGGAAVVGALLYLKSRS